MNENNTVKVKSVGKVIEILGIIAGENGALSLTEISKLSGYPITTVYGIIATLRD